MGYHSEKGPCNLKIGDIIQVLADGHAFSDAVILGFDDVGNAKLARPFAFADAEIPGNHPFVSMEIFTASKKNLELYVKEHGIIDHSRALKTGANYGQDGSYQSAETVGGDTGQGNQENTSPTHQDRTEG